MYSLNTQAYSSNNYSQNNIKEKNKLYEKITLIIVTTILTIILLIIIIFNVGLYKINGTSMSPTLKEKEYVLTYQPIEYKRGDIIAFHHNNAIIIKRIVGLPNDIIDFEQDGTVLINNKILSEPYLTSKALGLPDIKLPYTVPPESYFVLGDNRSDSIDSRDVAIGCVKVGDIVGKVEFSIFPPAKIK